MNILWTKTNHGRASRSSGNAAGALAEAISAVFGARAVGTSSAKPVEIGAVKGRVRASRSQSRNLIESTLADIASHDDLGLDFFF